MSKYIDADELRDGVMQFVNEYGEIVGMFVTDFNILVERCGADVVKRVHRGRRPSDDLVKVVRCKDCDMWSDSFEVKDLGKLCMNFRIVTKPDFYCAWGSKE